MSAPESMKALVWEGPREMAIRDVPVGEPGPGEVVLSVEAVGICGSELSGYLGQNSLRKPPLVMGHEFAGTVRAIGAAVEGLRAGQRVVVNPLLYCGNCRHCRHGRFNLCDNRALIGAHRPGAFAQSVVVPAKACFEVPDGLEMEIASLAEPLACAVRAVRLASLGLGDIVKIVGAGPIGLLSALVASEAGASVEISDTNPARVAQAARWGIRQLPTGAASEGFDAAIDAVGLEVTRRQAIESVRRGGRVVFVGLHGPATSFDGNDLVRNEVTISGSFAYTPEDFEVACRLLSAGVLPEERDWLSLRRLEEGAESFRELVDDQPEILKIVLQP